MTTYEVKYSSDAWTFYDVINPEYGSLTFVGNNDQHTVVENVLPEGVFARYVRILPKTWRSHPSMRADVSACPGAYTQALASSNSHYGERHACPERLCRDTPHVFKAINNCVKFSSLYLCTTSSVAASSVCSSVRELVCNGKIRELDVTVTATTTYSTAGHNHSIINICLDTDVFFNANDNTNYAGTQIIPIAT